MAEETNTVKVGNFDLIINQIGALDSDLNQNYPLADLSNMEIYLVLDLSVKNNTDEEAPIGNFVNFRMMNSEGATVQPIITEENGFDVNVPAGAVARGRMNYKVNKGESYRFRFCPNLIKGDYVDLPLTVN